MNKYVVYVLECHRVEFECEAVSENDAIEQAINGNGRWVDNSMEFVDSLDTDTWTVELIEEGEDTDLTDREKYLHSKINLFKEQILLLEKEGLDSSIPIELIKTSLNDLEEELSLVTSDKWKNIIGD